MIEERRTALRRAHPRAPRRCTSSARTGTARTSRPKAPSAFFDELAAWGDEDRRRRRSTAGPSDAERGEPAARVPRALRAADWPGPARPRRGRRRRSPTDGARPPLDATEAGGVAGALVEPLDADDARRFETARGRAPVSSPRTCGSARPPRAAGGRAGPPPRCRSAASSTTRSCPKRFYWTQRAPAPAVQRAGGADRHRGPPLDRAPRVAARASCSSPTRRPTSPHEELAGDPGKVERLRQAFLESRFAGVVPLYAERRVPAARRSGSPSSGRIDAIFGEPDGPWEVVDWKTGRSPQPTTRSRAAARPLRAGVRRDLGQGGPRTSRSRYLYLASGEEVVAARWATRPRFGPASRPRWPRSPRGEFEPTPGP